MNKKKFLSGLSRNVIILGVVSLLNDASSEMIYPLLPVFLTMTLGASAELLGLIEGVAESTASVLKFFSGWISDRWQKRKQLIVLGYGLSSLTRPVMAIAAAGWQVLLIRFGDRVGKGIRSAPRDAFIADSISEEVRGKAFGFHRAMDHAGAIIGPLLAMAVLALTADNYRIVFWIAAVPALAGVLVLFFGTREQEKKTSIKRTNLSLAGLDVNFRYYLGVVILFTLGNSSDAFLLLRARDLGVSVTLIPLLWVMLHIVKMASSMPGGDLSDKIGRKKVIIGGWIIYALVYAGFAGADSAWQIWALFIIYGLYFGLTEGAERAFVADLVPAELRGTAYGVFNLAVGIGAFPASIIMGVLWHRVSPVVAFGFGAAMSLLASLLLLRIRTSKKNA